MADFTEALFTVPKIDIEEIEEAAYDRGYKQGYKDGHYDAEVSNRTLAWE